MTMATPIVWDEDIPLPTAPKPAQKLVGGGLDFAPTEDLIAELGRRGIVVGPVAPYTYPLSGLPIAPYTITTTSATTPLGLGGIQNVASLGQLMGALGGTHK